MLSLLAAATVLAACGTATEQLPLTSLVLTADQVPDGFTVVAADVEDLVVSNRQALEDADSVIFAPTVCRPTADADFAPRLTPDNTVLLAAQNDDRVLLLEMITTVERDIDADRRTTTGVCREVTAIGATGTLAGSRIVTTYTELPGPVSAAVRQSLVLRADTVTASPEAAPAGVRTRSELIANLLVQRPDGRLVTVQLSAKGAGSAVVPTAPAHLEPPMAESVFAALIADAVERAAR